MTPSPLGGREMSLSTRYDKSKRLICPENGHGACKGEMITDSSGRGGASEVGATDGVGRPAWSAGRARLGRLAGRRGRPGGRGCVAGVAGVVGRAGAVAWL